MVKAALTTIHDPERALIVSYAPAGRRDGLAALLALDAALAGVLRTTRQPLVGQMRLAWWREALERLDRAAAPAEPVLRALAADALPHGVRGAALARMVEGWEALLVDPLDLRALQRHAVARGGRLFACITTMLDVPGRRLARFGRGWALADLSRHLSDVALAACAREMAMPRLATDWTDRGTAWPRAARAAGGLIIAARLDLADRSPPPGSPRRVARLAWHRLTGR
ncbi:squalene/phytoene synthase family protein [uncultured Sphingomonas sp.]|uniref:squalene/phytoene synthase family protein n=1 Tax=uncultured Sphingomonas sp. TaxID=158754 RepID=UPI0035C98FB0